jgi:hypothetical protein
LRKKVYSIDEPLIKYRTRPDQISKDPSLNNLEDLKVLAMQKRFVAPALYQRVLEFNRELRGLRYKEKAYDSLFRKRDPMEYARWWWKSVVTLRKAPSLASMAYLILGFLPGRLAERISGRGLDVGGLPSSDAVVRQDVLSEGFTWMGVPRGALNPEWLASEGDGQWRSGK